MENQESSALMFNLKETVWFRKGDEIGDLVNLSLEPAVNVQDMGEYVAIRGFLLMSGEYKKGEESFETEGEDDLTLSGKKFAAVVESREEGLSEFSFEFPVDITIPKNRITGLDALDVVVEMFDYQIPEPNQLTITTDILLHGVTEGSRQEAEPEEELSLAFESGNEEKSAEEELEESLISQESIQQKEEKDPSNVPVIFPLDFSGETRDEETFTVEAEGKKEEVRPEEFMPPVERQEDKAKNGRLEEESFSEILEAKKGKAVKREMFPALSDTEKDNPFTEPEKDLKPAGVSEDRPSALAADLRAGLDAPSPSKVQENQTDITDTEEAMQEWPAENRREEKRKTIHYQPKAVNKKDERPISLADYFAKKDESQPAQMKVYIVQEDDNLFSIAERYEILVSQLIKANHLEPDQEVRQGQVLYIPEKKQVSAE
jgi:stage VI sporulation protein D